MAFIDHTQWKKSFYSLSLMRKFGGVFARKQGDALPYKSIFLLLLRMKILLVQIA